MMSAGGRVGGGGPQKSRRKEQNQLICDSERGGSLKPIQNLTVCELSILT